MLRVPKDEGRVRSWIFTSRGELFITELLFGSWLRMWKLDGRWGRTAGTCAGISMHILYVQIMNGNRCTHSPISGAYWNGRSLHAISLQRSDSRRGDFSIHKPC